MKELSYLNFIIAILFAACYSYQLIYMVVSLSRKQKKFTAVKQHKFGAIIAARNEEAVLAQLVESIRWQKYPGELIDIFVVADNCTDNTAQLARSLGCIVYERSNQQQVGKGYALDFLFSHILEDYGNKAYEGFMIFDADNILDENYFTEMNKVFDNGYSVVTSYRNSKNFGDSWISSSYSLWFLKEARFLNNPRMTLGASCAVSGTGYLVSGKIIEEMGGWKFFTLTEDFEFTFSRIAKDDMIGYAEDAIIYDEQPTELGPSLVQRSRWVKGFLQALRLYTGKMVKKIVFDGSFSSFDMFMNGIPSYILTLFSVVLNVSMFVLGIVTGQDMNILIYSCVTTIANAYIFLAFIGGLTAYTERKRIQAPVKKLVLATLSFPLFVGTYVFALLIAIFTNVSWKPIKHKVAATTESMKNSQK